MLAQRWKNVKTWAGENRNDLFIAALIFLVGMASFGLGRLSVLWPAKEPITITNNELQKENKPAAENREGAAAIGSSLPDTNGRYVGSKSGKAYHYPWCAGAQKIKEENKIWFQTKAEAQNKGYTPASNCPGL